MRQVIALIGLLLLQVAVLEAQQPPGRTGFVVQQMQVCPLENQDAINRFNDDVLAPIVEQLKTEGRVRSWMVLTHAWGDEWNNVWITVTDSHQAFLEFWSEVVNRLNRAAPNWQTEILPLCTLHKDNMYFMRNGR